MRELKPCPFCGGEAHIMKMGYPHWVLCKQCGAKVHGGKFGEKEGEAASIEAWNRRTSYSCDHEKDHTADSGKMVERTAETAQNVSDGDLNWAIPSVLSNLVPAGVVAGIVQNQLRLEESIHRITQITGIGIDDLIDLLAQGYELKAPSAQLHWIGMNHGKARAIFDNIENASESIEEIGEAIYIVMNMETHNSVTRSNMLKVIRWLWDRTFEIERWDDDNNGIN